MTPLRGLTAKGMAATLSRLLLVLAVMLLGGHQGAAARSAPDPDPLAVLETTLVPAILTAQSQLASAPAPQDDTPASAVPVPQAAVFRQTTSGVAPSAVASLHRPEIIILPPVRAPPAA